MEQLLLTMYHDLNKNFGFYEARLGSEGASQILEEEKKFSVVALAGESDAILFTRESYKEYPNLWVASDGRFRNQVQVSHLHEDLLERFAWGDAELVEWLNMHGEYVQSVQIYTANYETGK